MRVKSAPVREPDDQYQRDNKVAVDGVLSVPLLQGVLVTTVSLTTGTTRVAHNLGRVARGFFIVDATADVRAWRDATAPASLSFISLKASASATVSLWVF